MKYATIYKSSLVDGIGWRTVLFVSGCSHHCKNCHNPQTWDPEFGRDFTEKTTEYILSTLEHNEINGLTISGGDPLFKANREEITKLCKTVKEKYPKKSIWLYTGYVYEDVKDLEVMKYIDIIVDGPYIDEQRDTSLPFRGSANQRIISLSTGKEVRYGLQ